MIPSQGCSGTYVIEHKEQYNWNMYIIALRNVNTELQWILKLILKTGSKQIRLCNSINIV